MFIEISLEEEEVFERQAEELLGFRGWVSEAVELERRSSFSIICGSKRVNL